MVEGAIGDIKRYRVIKTGFEFVGMKLADNIVIDMTGVRRLFNGRDSELTVETVRLKPEVREFFNNYLAYWKAIDSAKDEIKRITELYQKKIQQETAEINKNMENRRNVLERAETAMREGYLLNIQNVYTPDARLNENRLNALARKLADKASNIRDLRVSTEYATVDSWLDGTCENRVIVLNYFVFICKYEQDKYSFVMRDYDNTCYVDMYAVTNEMLDKYMSMNLNTIIKAVPNTKFSRQFDIGDKCTLTFTCEVRIPVVNGNVVETLEKLV